MPCFADFSVAACEGQKELHYLACQVGALGSAAAGGKGARGRVPDETEVLAAGANLEPVTLEPPSAPLVKSARPLLFLVSFPFSQSHRSLLPHTSLPSLTTPLPRNQRGKQLGWPAREISRHWGCCLSDSEHMFSARWFRNFRSGRACSSRVPLGPAAAGTPQRQPRRRLNQRDRIGGADSDS